MITPILILISSLLFFAGFFNSNFAKFPKKLISRIKKPFFPSPAPALKRSSSLTNSLNVENKDNEDGLKQVFDSFDKNGDGFITMRELEESLSNIGIFVQVKEVEEMVRNLDSNKDGLIDIDEFRRLFKLVKGKEKEKRDDDDDDDDEEGDLKEAFDVFDGNKDGLITVEELGLVLTSMGLMNEERRVEDCKKMIKMVDVDGDGMVNFDEFKRMMRYSCATSRLVPAF